MRLKTAAALLSVAAGTYATDDSQYCADAATTILTEWAATPSVSLFASVYATSLSKSFTPFCVRTAPCQHARSKLTFLV